MAIVKILTALNVFSTSAFSSLSESFFMVKGAALFLQQGGSAQGPKTPTHHKHAGRNKCTEEALFRLLFAHILCTNELQTKGKLWLFTLLVCLYLF